jgi:hypothetical protein
VSRPLPHDAGHEGSGVAGEQGKEQRRRHFPITFPPGKFPDANPPAGPGIRPRRGSSGAHAGKSVVGARMAADSQDPVPEAMICLQLTSRETRRSLRACLSLFSTSPGNVNLGLERVIATSPPRNPEIGVAAGKLRGSPRPRWPRPRRRCASWRSRGENGVRHHRRPDRAHFAPSATTANSRGTPPGSAKAQALSGTCSRCIILEMDPRPGARGTGRFRGTSGDKGSRPEVRFPV